MKLLNVVHHIVEEVHAPLKRCGLAGHLLVYLNPAAPAHDLFEGQLLVGGIEGCPPL